MEAGLAIEQRTMNESINLLDLKTRRMHSSHQDGIGNLPPGHKLLLRLDEEDDNAALLPHPQASGSMSDFSSIQFLLV